MKKSIRVLYIDDNSADRERVRDSLKTEGISVTEAVDRNEFETLCFREEFDIVLSDIGVPGFSGLEIIDMVKTIKCDLPVLLVTGRGSEKMAVEAFKKGVADYVIKAPENIGRLARVIEDVLERKAQSETFRENQNRYQVVVESTRDLIIQVDGEGHILFVNRASEKIWGLKPEECAGRSAFSFIHEDDLNETRARFKLYIKDRVGRGTFENRQVSRTGDVFYISWVTNFHYDNAGRITCVNGIGRNITERKRSELLLSRWAHVFHHTKWGIAICTADAFNTLELMNPAYAEMHGFTCGELIGRPVAELFAAEYREEVALFIDTVGKLGHFTFESEHIRKDTTLFPVLIDATAVADKKGNIDYYVLNVLDITERKKAEDTARFDEERLASLLKLSQIRWHDRQDLANFALEEAVRLTKSKVGYLHFIHKNQKTIELFSWSKGVSQKCLVAKTGHYPIERAGIWADSLRHRKPVVHNDYPNYQGKKGYPEGHFPVLRHMSVPIFDNDKVVAIAGVGNKEDVYDASDIRQLTLFMNSMWKILKEKQAELDNKRLEGQLRQIQKMDAIGTLAGGIAHDFNNILSAILGYADLAKRDLAEQPDVAVYLDSIAMAGERAKGLVQQILTFSHQSEVKHTALSPALVVRETSKMLRASIPTTIEIKQAIDPDCSSIMADPTQIHQVVMNLCTNAYQAMEQTGGIITITLQTKDIAGDDVPDGLNLKSGKYVELGVADTGGGIDPVIGSKIFDPYFTTKETGKGTGLGLAIVHSILTDLGGTIIFDTKQGLGTTFKAYFPVFEQAAPEDSSEAEELPTGNEQILFIDDEEMLANMSKHMLERLGYRVTVEKNSLAALKIFFDAPDTFDVIITDQTMPGLTGTDLAQLILKERPDIPIILCTGYSNLINEETAKSLGIKAFAMKPFNQMKLAKLIREALT